MTTYSDAQVMMTLAGLCYAGQQKLYLESVDLQEQRILALLNGDQALGNHQLATAGNWKASWVGLSDDRANMAFIAQNALQNQLAIAMRGTDFQMAIDRDEDFCVGETVPFPQGGLPPTQIARGAMEAFQEVTQSKFVQTGTTLYEALKQAVEAMPGATVFVTGHSLGGAIATTVALYLAAEAKAGQLDAAFKIYTYAAPTAGLADFAQAFDREFADSSWRLYNLYDAVPCAWQDLDQIKTFYPAGPEATFAVKVAVDLAKDHAGKLAYTQPSVNPVLLNQQVLKDPRYTYDTTWDFLHQVPFQHHGNTYLTLLEAPIIPPLPSHPGNTPAS